MSELSFTVPSCMADERVKACVNAMTRHVDDLEEATSVVGPADVGEQARSMSAFSAALAGFAYDFMEQDRAATVEFIDVLAQLAKKHIERG